MTRKDVVQYIAEKYRVNPECLWLKYPDDQIFRHENNRKWFGLIMCIPKCKIGLNGNEKIDVLDVKCTKETVFLLKNTEGYYPAYHMNKANWITVVLDDTLSDDTIKNLIDDSFKLTATMV